MLISDSSKVNFCPFKAVFTAGKMTKIFDKSDIYSRISMKREYVIFIVGYLRRQHGNNKWMKHDGQHDRL